MITLKQWNSLTQSQRDKAVTIIFPHCTKSEDLMHEFAQPWHHNIDNTHDHILHCIYEKDGIYTVKVCFGI